MEDRLAMRVGVINDGSAAALAEFVHGAGRGTRDLVLLTLGTGVGGGFVLGGQLYRGWAEVGHMVIVEDGEPCQGACTGRGHVESYCSGLAADRLARRLLGPGATARDLVEQRHPALGEIGRHLGVAISSLVNLFDPDVVVLGGGFGVAAGDLLLEPAREVMRRDTLAPAGDTVRLAIAELGPEAGVIGAGLVAFETLG
jgi:glucokinase